jgi:serine/threonine-protein kinase
MDPSPDHNPDNTSAQSASVRPVQIGRFVVQEEIGRGSNGVVYAATDPVLGREVAIKAIPLDAANSRGDTSNALFLQEAKTAAGLNHPGIVTVFEAGQSDNLAFIAMERLHGVDLHHWLADHRVMSPRSAAALVARVADALHFAHQRGLIHRDIKPSNIFLGPDGKPKLLDFGVALAHSTDTPDGARPRLIGTPNYMSPEQARGQPLDPRSDVFSLGAILYELLSGHGAFEGDSVETILGKVVRSNPPPLSHWRPDMDPLMSTIVDRALAKEPSKRYPDAAQLRNDLAGFAGRQSTAAATVSTTPPLTLLSEIPGNPLWRRVGLAVLAVVAASCLLSLGVWLGRQSAAPVPDVSSVATDRPEPTQQPGNTQPLAPEPVPASMPSAAPDITRKDPVVARHPDTTPPPHKAVSTPAPTSAPEAPISPPPSPPQAPGTLALAIVPWGQVLVDGTNVGYAPPLNRLSLQPGRHTIEIRNGGAPEYLTQVQVESGKLVTIQHRF